MKILIGYDGSRCADAAIAELDRAGLPNKAEVAVLSVRELWAPQLHGYGAVAGEMYDGDVESHESLERILASARARLEERFGGWAISLLSKVGSPARTIVDEATDWGADLVVVGSHGLTGLSRFLLGSVSHKVAIDAPCSVRVTRETKERRDGPARIVISYKGSPSGEEAVRAVAARTWPEGSEARLVTVLGPGRVLGARFEAMVEEVKQEHRTALESLADGALAVSSQVVEGDPRRLVPEIAEQWGADSIFVGTRDLSRAGRFALGSVSSAILGRAHCTVEIARP